MAHRWQAARLLDQGLPYLEVAQRDGRVDDDGDARRALAAPRRGRLPAGARPAEARSRSDRLTIAVPAKGRLREPSVALLDDAGLGPEQPGERALAFPCRNAPVDVLLVRAADVPEYVQDGVVDCGITGADLVARARRAASTSCCGSASARCTLEAAVPDGVAASSARRARRARASRRSTRGSPRELLASAGSRSSSSTSPARSRSRRGSASPTRSSISSRAGARCGRTACARSARCSRRRRCSIGARGRRRARASSRRCCAASSRRARTAT